MLLLNNIQNIVCKLLKVKIIYTLYDTSFSHQNVNLYFQELATDEMNRNNKHYHRSY